MTEKYLSGRAALVTGGVTGIGKAIALALADAGADLVIGSLPESRTASLLGIEDAVLPTEDEFAGAKSAIETCGGGCLAVALDVRSNDSVQAFYDAAVERFGTVDILVNAAGVGAVQSMIGHSDELWDQMIDVCLTGSYRTIKRCLPGMIDRRWGRIINIASSYAHVGSPDEVAYCAAKAGVLGLTRSVALEGAPHHVTCNSISPSWTKTGMVLQSAQHQVEIGATEHLTGETGDMTADEFLDKVAQSYPQKRLVEPPEIAALAAFLCRDEALAITMEDIRVSAGSLA